MKPTRNCKPGCPQLTKHVILASLSLKIYHTGFSHGFFRCFWYMSFSLHSGGSQKSSEFLVRTSSGPEPCRPVLKRKNKLKFPISKFMVIQVERLHFPNFCHSKVTLADIEIKTGWK